MRIITYDFETTGLDAQKGDILTMGYKWLNEKRARAVSVLDFFTTCSEGRVHYKELPLVQAVHKILSDADLMITFNGKNFDWGLIKTKFMKYRLPPLPEIAHVDLYQVARSNMRLSPKSLKNIAKYLGLKHQKMELPIDVWLDAGRGDVKAIKTLVKRGASDVLLTEELYLDHLRPYVRLHPRLNGYDACRYCGTKNLVRHGQVPTHYKTPQYRFDCKNCGGHETRSLTKEEKEWYGERPE